MYRKTFYNFLLLFLLPVLLMGATKGRIKGKVVDANTKEALIGANVVVVGTSQGAATDSRGEFVVMQLDPGVYTLKASYVGYQTVTMSNVRVSSELTTEITFLMPAEGFQTKNIEVVADRPLIQKDNTNKIRTTTSEDIQALPVRSVTDIIALSAGVTLKDDAVFIRGGRLDEVGFYLEGTNVTNPMFGGRGANISQDAIEEIQVQTGGYTAEFGNANAGLVRQQLKSGTDKYKFSMEYITDNITLKSSDDAFDGKKRLGAYWYGYNEFSATAGGPIPVWDNRIKFFANLNYRFDRDDTPQGYPGVDLGPIKMASGDSIDFVYPAGAVKGNSSQRYTYTGTLNFDFNPIIVRLSGVYTSRRADTWRPVLQNLMQDRLSETQAGDGVFTLKATHMVSPNFFYEVSGGLFFSWAKTRDPYIGSDFWNYGNPDLNEKLGWGNTGAAYMNIYGYPFTKNGDIDYNYTKNDRKTYNFSLSASYNLGKTHSFKAGINYEQLSLRNWSVGTQVNFYSAINNLADSIKNNPAKLEAEKRALLLTNGVNNYGYDVFGNKLDDDEFFGPKQPVFFAAYIQDKIEYEDLILNLGLRLDYIDTDNKMFKNADRPQDAFDFNSGELIKEGWVDVPSYTALSPRLGFSFPITDRTNFYAQFGRFVQQTRLVDVYQGYYRTSFELRGGFFIPSPVGKNIRPTRTTSYEIGFSQQMTDFMSFSVTGFYRTIKDQVEFVAQQVASGTSFKTYYTLGNGDFSTTKGLEIEMTMRRYERLALNGSIAFQDAQGTGSFPNSNRGIVGSPLDGVTVFTPKYISPLEYNNSVRASLNFDYRFGENDGPAVLHEAGVSVLMKYSSGHPYTRGIGGDDLEGDARNRQPVEPLGASTTPSTFQVDLRIDKSFTIYDKLKANVYIYVINLFDKKNIENVFLRTGSTTDDGYINNPSTGGKIVENDPRFYDFYQALNIDYYERYQNAASLQTTPFFYGDPRQIRLGIRLEY